MNVFRNRIQAEDSQVIPSALGSLTSSADQLRQLALEASDYYIRGLLVLGQATLDSDQNKPDQIRLYLPFLSDLCAFHDEVLRAVELFIRRLVYHLNQQQQQQQAENKGRRTKSNLNGHEQDDQFALPNSFRFEPLASSLMDLLYALASLDSIIRWDTQLESQLEQLEELIRVNCDAKSALDEEEKLEADIRQLQQLHQVQVTLCNPSGVSLFRQLMLHLQQLQLALKNHKAGSRLAGYDKLKSLFEETLQFQLACQADHTEISQRRFLAQHKLGSTLRLLVRQLSASVFLHDPCRRSFGLLALFVFYCWLHKDPKLIGPVVSELRESSKVGALNSQFNMNIHEFVCVHLAGSNLDRKLLARISQARGADKRVHLDPADYQSGVQSFLSKAHDWKAQLVASLTVEANHDLTSILEHGIDLAIQANQQIQSVGHKKISSVLSLIGLVKWIQCTLKGKSAMILRQTKINEQALAIRWRKLMTSVRLRLLAQEKSTRNLKTNSIVVLTQIGGCFNTLESSYGCTMISICLGCLAVYMTQKEIDSLNELLTQLQISGSFWYRLREATKMDYLYWHKHNMDELYESFHLMDQVQATNSVHFFEQIRLLLLAIEDVPRVFALRKGRPSQNHMDKRIENQANFLMDQVKDQLISQFKRQYFDRICQQFELELKLQLLSELFDEDPDPLRRRLVDFERLLMGQPDEPNFILFDTRFSLQESLTSVVHRMSLGLSAASQAGLIRLAKSRYNLPVSGLLVSNVCPETDDQRHTFDLPATSQNLGSFLSRFSYDQVNEMFIDKMADPSHLSSSVSTMSKNTSYMNSTNGNSSDNPIFVRVLQSKHFSDSIRMHGFTILNQILHRSYETMQRLIRYLGRQTANRMVVSILNDCRMQQNQDKNASRYGDGLGPSIGFDLAEQLVKKLRHVKNRVQPLEEKVNAWAEEGNGTSVPSDLESIRQSVTQLGNLVAFIMMLNRGARECAIESAHFVTHKSSRSGGQGDRWTQLVRMSQELSSSMTGICKSDNADDAPDKILSEFVVKAAHFVDRSLQDLDDITSARDDYLQVMIRLFKMSQSDATCNDAKKRLSNGRRQMECSVSMDRSGFVNGPDKRAYIGHDPDPESTMVFHDNHQVKSNDGKNFVMKNGQLKNFYVMVPSLMISYLEHVSNHRDRLLSRSANVRCGPTLLSDDGLLIGVAFLLNISNQIDKFLGLHWFQEVNERFHRERATLEDRLKDKTIQESLKQTSRMSLKRIMRLKLDYDCLDQGIQAALLMMKSHDKPWNDDDDDFVHSPTKT